MAILRILANSPNPMGSKLIARQLGDDYGISLSERSVRYYLEQLDAQGFTTKISRRDGRQLTEMGVEEIGNAMVGDKIGFVFDKIELLAYQTTFDPRSGRGMIPVNFSLFPKNSFRNAMKAMAPSFKAGLCVSNLVAVAEEGTELAGITIPRGKVGFATVCSIVANGVLLKSGIPIDSRFSGLLQMNRCKPWRFADLIQYAGSSLDPSEIFIAGHMTTITRTVKTGDGKILANFREIPAQSLPLARQIFSLLDATGINQPLVLGDSGKAVCEIPVGANKAGIVLTGGLNPVAAAVEAGYSVSNKAMSCVLDFALLRNFEELV